MRNRDRSDHEGPGAIFLLRRWCVQQVQVPPGPPERRYQATGPSLGNTALIKLQVARQRRGRFQPAHHLLDDPDASYQAPTVVWLPQASKSGISGRCWFFDIARCEQRVDSQMSMNRLSRLHTIACGQTDIHQDQIRAVRFSHPERLTRGHGDASHSMPRRFQVSLRVQGNKRFVFDYENSHDMMGQSGSLGQVSDVERGQSEQRNFRPVPLAPDLFRQRTNRCGILCHWGAVLLMTDDYLSADLIDFSL